MNDLVVANINFPGKGTPKTYKDKHGVPSTTLDYICTRRSAKGCIQDVIVKEGPISSDHRYLISKIAIHSAFQRKKQKTIKKDTYLLTYDRFPQWQDAFVKAFKDHNNDNALYEPQNMTYSEFCDRVNAAMDILPEAGKKPKLQAHWNTAACKNLVLLNDVVPLQKDEELRNMLKKARLDDVGNLVNQYAAQLKKHPKKAWEFIHCMKPSVTAKLPAKSNDERLQKFYTQFSGLYKSGPSVVPPLPEPRFDVPLVFNSQLFTQDEVKNAIKTLQNYKSTGFDGIQNEVLKLEGLLEPITHLMNRMLQGDVTLEQKKSILVPLPKKGDLSNTSNWRGISLMSHVTKLFDKLLMLRLRDVIDKHLYYGQNGFREKRGCVQHILALSMLRDLSQTHDYPVHLCYVDFSKAFDSVKWEAIQRELEYWHTPQLLIDAIFNVMKGHSLCVRCDGEYSATMPVEVGVLQGDTLAPYLFVIVMDSILRRIDHSLGVELGDRPKKMTARQRALYYQEPQKRLAALAFADDVVLLAHNLADLQILFTQFEQFALELGLKLNLGEGKTERMFFGKNLPPGDLLTLANKTVPVVESYKYLGTHVTSFEKEWGLKKGKAWAILNKFESLWKAKIKWEYKRRLFRALIEPIFTYGLCAWPLTASRTARINATFGRMLRKCIGLPSVKMSYYNRNFVRSEKLFAECPFLSTSIRVQRAKLVLKAWKEHTNGTRKHPFIDILLYEPSEYVFKKIRGPRYSVKSALLRDLRIEFVEQISSVYKDEKQLVKTLESLKEMAQNEVWSIKERRRMRKEDRDMAVGRKKYKKRPTRAHKDKKKRRKYRPI